MFAEFNDGSWGIIGVNNLGSPDSTGQFGYENITFWMDNRFGQFWNSIFNPGAAKTSSTTQAVSSDIVKATSNAKAQRYP